MTMRMWSVAGLCLAWAPNGSAGARDLSDRTGVVYRVRAGKIDDGRFVPLGGTPPAH